MNNGKLPAYEADNACISKGADHVQRGTSRRGSKPMKIGDSEDDLNDLGHLLLLLYLMEDRGALRLLQMQLACCHWRRGTTPHKSDY